jgi:hypothetical protein
VYWNRRGGPAQDAKADEALDAVLHGRAPRGSVAHPALGFAFGVITNVPDKICTENWYELSQTEEGRGAGVRAENFFSTRLEEYISGYARLDVPSGAEPGFFKVTFKAGVDVDVAVLSGNGPLIPIRDGGPIQYRVEIPMQIRKF